MLLFFVRRCFLTVSIGGASHSGAKVSSLFLCNWVERVGHFRLCSSSGELFLRRTHIRVFCEIKQGLGRQSQHLVFTGLQISDLSDLRSQTWPSLDLEDLVRGPEARSRALGERVRIILSTLWIVVLSASVSNNALWSCHSSSTTGKWILWQPKSWPKWVELQCNFYILRTTSRIGGHFARHFVGTREALTETFRKKRLIYLYVSVGTREALTSTW